MELHSPIYLLFLVVAAAMLTVVRSRAGRMLLFLGLSYGFYLGWSATLLLLLLASSLFNFIMFRLLGRHRSSSLIWVGVAVNLLILLSARSLSTWLAPAVPELGLLPVGVSFYTLQGLGSLIDRYRGYDEQLSVLEFLVFMALWPVILAGPICRLPEMLPQFRQTRAWVEARWEGIRRIVLGLFMKVVLADSLAQGLFGKGGVDSGFDQAQVWSSTDVVSLAFGYGLQLFFDFAGYSHIAIGSALLVGIRLRENFRSPFEAISPSDFWTRWHVSLSSWIRDYVFFPLAARWRSQKGRLLAVVGAMCVFGAWHGLTATFVIWGLYHGLALSIQRVLERSSLPILKAPSIVRWALTCLFINLGWVLFRVDSLEQAGRMYGALFSIGQPASMSASFQFVVIAMMAGHLLLCVLRPWFLKWTDGNQIQAVLRLVSPAYVAAMLLLTLAWGEGQSPFVYVQF